MLKALVILAFLTFFWFFYLVLTHDRVEAQELPETHFAVTVERVTTIKGKDILVITDGRGSVCYFVPTSGSISCPR